MKVFKKELVALQSNLYWKTEWIAGTSLILSKLYDMNALKLLSLDNQHLSLVITKQDQRLRWVRYTTVNMYK